MRLSRKVFEEQKRLLKKRLGVSDVRLAELLRMDYQSASYAASGKLLSITGNRFDYHWIDMFDDFWFYKRCLHLVSNGDLNSDISEGVDTTPLSNLEQDVTLDTMIDGNEVYIRLSHRNFPIVVRDKRYYWTVSVYTDYHDPEYIMTFNETDRLVKVLVHECSVCNKCGRCTEASCGGTYIRPRVRENCKLESIGKQPLEIIAMLMDVVNRYLNREKLSRKRYKAASENPLRSLMIACEDNDADTERVMPMFTYVKEYCPSKPYVYKGGHHKSPVSHTRSGYFRRSRCGDHILKDGEFVKVEKGLGQYTYVAPQLVNASKDAVMANIV